jgi:hypothetical protein
VVNGKMRHEGGCRSALERQPVCCEYKFNFCGGLKDEKVRFVNVFVVNGGVCPGD